MKLKREAKPEAGEIVLDPHGIYELGGYGVLMEEYPKKRHIVKNALTGKLMDKRSAYPCARTPNGFIFYLPIGQKLESEDLESLIPSRFDELKGN